MLGIDYSHAWKGVFPCWEWIIPMLGMIRSKHGNISFPAWELLVPSMEIDAKKNSKPPLSTMKMMKTILKKQPNTLIIK